ncbi:EpsG family protein [Sediminibacterium sp.]|uniref:EpsG family protein n=1 Tax=Sediminibacterium sp. TaxID=1917865 RepID=UPI003F7032C9
MIASLIISGSAIFISWLSRYQRSRYGCLELSFLLLAIFIGFRYNFGNDYIGYLDSFQEVNKDENPFMGHNEFGWTLICLFFQPIGFFGMNIVLTGLEFFILYLLVKKNVPPKWYWLSIFIFSMNTGFMLVFSSMMRQFLAICIFILASEFIYNKRWIVALLLILLATLMHTTAFILLPFVLLGFLNITLSTQQIFYLLIFYCIIYFIGTDLLSSIILKILIFEQFKRYELYMDTESFGESSGLGVLFNFILFIVLLLHQKYQPEKIKFYFTLFSFYIFFQFFTEIASMISRLSFYFSIFSIVAFPWMFEAIKNILAKYLILTIYILMILKSFFDFFDQSGIWHKHFYNYQSIFSSNSWM